MTVTSGFGSADFRASTLRRAARTTTSTLPTVLIAGVAWPLYKVQALMVAAVLLAAVGVGTGSAELTAWVVTAGTVMVWWVQRTRHQYRPSV
ncbi:hypothetical protein [Williamsia sterculiae]|uniref:hypothetical protein n=1 Tax=Williamsia sterculiae TaxID=1344003 RepID=UPI0009FB0783|nr:hypothetical protein [Williamsia sterculiae]